MQLPDEPDDRRHDGDHSGNDSQCVGRRQIARGYAFAALFLIVGAVGKNLLIDPARIERDTRSQKPRLRERSGITPDSARRAHGGSHPVCGSWKVRWSGEESKVRAMRLIGLSIFASSVIVLAIFGGWPSLGSLRRVAACGGRSGCDRGRLASARRASGEASRNDRSGASSARAARAWATAGEVAGRNENRGSRLRQRAAMTPEWKTQANGR